MCLLDMFGKMLPAEEYAVAHCNFSLRGDESDGDQALVEARAAELGVRVFVKRFQTQSYACENGISIEMAARALRYEWFSQLCIEHGFDVLAVAHNANDNAETLMLNLLRGTGLNGLHGMSEITCSDVGGSDGAEGPSSALIVFRPLLEYTRKQIEGYVLAHRVPYRHDSSNFSSDYKRNKIRNEVFPVFEKINPSFVRTLNREIGYFSEAGSIVEDWCRMQLPNVILDDSCNAADCGGHGRVHLRIKTDALLATSHWRYLLYYILEPFGFNSMTLASLETLLTSGRTVSGKRFEAPEHALLTTRDSLLVVSLSSCSADHDYGCLQGRTAGSLGQSDTVIAVRGPGIYDFNGTRFEVEVLEWTEGMSFKQPQGTLILDAAKMSFPFVCRRWRQGDWLVPFGMRGRKKVSDIFADLKYDTLEKKSAIIMVDTQTEGLAGQQHVAGLLGVRIDDRYKVCPSSASVIRISVLPNLTGGL